MLFAQTVGDFTSTCPKKPAGSFHLSQPGLWHFSKGPLGSDNGAQIFNLPYRRIGFCGAFELSRAFRIINALPIANRRYGRFQICATALAGSWSAVGEWVIAS
jgi:hypothetical protein